LVGYEREACAKGEVRLSKDIEREIKGERANGVVYNPEYERQGNYVLTALTDRYDAFIYIDRSEAMHPLYLPAEEGDIKESLPETFLTGR
jgi:erythromycin esterase-like protein